MLRSVDFIGRIHSFVERLFNREFWYLNRIVNEKIKDHCIMILPASLGDTLLVLANIELIEKETGVPIFPMLKTNQTVIAELCHRRGYAVFSDISNLYCLPCVKKAYHCISGNQVRARMKPKVRPGTLFLAHPDNYSECAQIVRDSYSMPEMYCNFFRLHTVPLFPGTVCEIECSREIFDPEHTIMLCPEACTSSLLPPDFWSSLCSEVKKLGWNVCYNAVAPAEFLPRELWLNCSTRDAVAVGQRVAFVISLRSGLSDLLANIGEKLIVIYPDQTFFEMHDLNTYFSRNDIYSCVYRQKANTISAIVNYIQSRAFSNDSLYAKTGRMSSS